MLNCFTSKPGCCCAAVHCGINVIIIVIIAINILIVIIIAIIIIMVIIIIVVRISQTGCSQLLIGKC